MSDKVSLLPHYCSKLERRLSWTFADISNIPVPINSLWSADNCPVANLPWLAWSVSVDEWSADWSFENQRNAIKNSIYIHKHKGTLESVRRVLRSAGFGETEIIEDLDLTAYNGRGSYNGDFFYGDNEHWAMYRIYLSRPISIEQAEEVKKLLKNTVPARCHLAGLHYEQASHLYNNVIHYDGQYTYGVA